VSLFVVQGRRDTGSPQGFRAAGLHDESFPHEQKHWRGFF
jgi:hypothetical protein